MTLGGMGGASCLGGTPRSRRHLNLIDMYTTFLVGVAFLSSFWAENGSVGLFLSISFFLPRRALVPARCFYSGLFIGFLDKAVPTVLSSTSHHPLGDLLHGGSWLTFLLWSVSCSLGAGSWERLVFLDWFLVLFLLRSVLLTVCPAFLLTLAMTLCGGVLGSFLLVFVLVLS